MLLRAPALCVLLALAAVLFTGCGVLAPSSPLRDRSPEPFDYHSRLEDPSAKALYAFSLAIMRHNHGDLEGVVSALKQAQTFDPHTPGLRLYLAEVLMQLDRDDEALAQLEDLVVEHPDSAPALRMLGELLLDGGLYVEADKVFTRLVQLLPGDEDALLLLVQSQAKQGDSIRAIDTLKDFLVASPDSYRGHYALARLYSQIGLVSAAEQSFRRVIELQPGLMSVYVELGQLFERRDQSGDLLRAIAVYRDGLARQERDAILRHRLVQVLLKQEDYPSARRELETLLADNPDDREALRKYGLLLVEQHDWPKAAQTFEHLLAISDDRATVRYYLGNVYENTAQPYEALREFLQIPVESELYPDARIHAAYLYRKLGEPRAAYQVLVPLLDNPRLTVDHVLLTTALAEEAGNATESLQYFHHGEKRFPGNTRLIYQRGALLEKLGMHDAARQAMEEVLGYDPNHSEAMNFIAYQYAEDGVNLDKALELAQRALALNESGHIYDTLGWVLYRLARYAEALDALQSARKQIPDDPVIHEHIGDVQQAMGHTAAALKSYSRSLELDPANSRLRQKLESLR